MCQEDLRSGANGAFLMEIDSKVSVETGLRTSRSANMKREKPWDGNWMTWRSPLWRSWWTWAGRIRRAAWTTVGYDVLVLDTKWKLLDGLKANGKDKYGLSQSGFYQLQAFGPCYWCQSMHRF